MKCKYIIPIFLVGLFCSASISQAESERPPMIGIQLDPTPLPELLTKHLALDPDQGIRILNVSADSPADKAGLEKDDIIASYNGEKAIDNEEFVNTIRRGGADTEISLEIIHLGKHKTVNLKPEVPEEEIIWKYPPEPELVRTWRPGKMFRLGPDEEKWFEVLPEHFPDIDVYKHFNENYTYQYAEDGERYTVIINGNPDDEDTEIIVRSGKTEFKATIDQIDKLPEKYHESIGISLENARKSHKQRMSDKKHYVPSPPMPDIFQRYFDQDFQNQFPIRPLNPENGKLERMEEQMQKLLERLEKLEKQHKENSPQEKSDKQEPETETTGEV